MVTNRLIKELDDGSFVLALLPCTCRILAWLLDPNTPIVWVTNHWPHRVIQWWETSVPLTKADQPRRLRVRGLSYDLQMNREDFLAVLPEFEEFGINLYQMTRPVPDTLRVEQLAENVRRRVLIQNGAVTHFQLPHAGEVAVFWSMARATVERALEHPDIRSLAIPNK
jgi:hypothetical protein